MKKKKQIDVFELRKSTGLTQAQFWVGVGKTQSAGSRYENGRSMDGPTEKLVDAVHVSKIITPEQLKKLGGIFK